MAAGAPGHIFNLGHGVLPETDPGVLARLVELVHSWRPCPAVDGSGVTGHRSACSSWRTARRRRPHEVEAFYTDVRRGRPPSDEQLAELVGRYEAIGGVSPLSRRTAEQVAGIQQQLEGRFSGRFRCTLGNKHSDPRIEDAVEQLAGEGARGIVGLVLAPHYSRGSVGEYIARAGGPPRTSVCPLRSSSSGTTIPS